MDSFELKYKVSELERKNKLNEIIIWRITPVVVSILTSIIIALIVK